jgi:DNA helicase-2/ATP-dependent DNA helicase PcrA
VDLLLGGDERLEILDFKTSEKPANSPDLLAAYEAQFCTYAHILESRYGKRPERFLLYWTAESRKADALIEFPYRPELVQQAAVQFDAVNVKIQARDFNVTTPPERKICKECDLRRLCAAQGVILAEGREPA